jgi:GntR family transcriptional repressor for pyruvate dehydrogenase complex
MEQAEILSAPTMSQTEVVISGIKHMLSSGELSPGQRLPVEKDLAAVMGVSRGSLREGVRALSTMGILEVRQGAGTFVSGLEPSALLSAMEFWVGLQEGDRAGEVHAVRRALETEAAGVAAGRISEEDLDRASAILGLAEEAISAEPTDHEAALKADVEFHRLIAEASGNRVLAALIETLSGRTIRLRMWRSEHDAQGLRDTHREHLAVLNALRRRDPERARVRMAGHLYGVEDYVRNMPEESGDGPEDGKSTPR